MLRLYLQYPGYSQCRSGLTLHPFRPSWLKLPPAYAYCYLRKPVVWAYQKLFICSQNTFLLSTFAIISSKANVSNVCAPLSCSTLFSLRSAPAGRAFWPKMTIVLWGGGGGGGAGRGAAG